MKEYLRIKIYLLETSYFSIIKGDIGGALYINRSYNGIVKNFAVGIMVNDTLCGLG